jgi:hypothetical protein
VGILSVTGLSTKDPRTTAFVVEAYSDAGYTTLVDTGTSPAVYDRANNVSKMVGIIRFRTLITGTTYYLRSASVIQDYGVSDWTNYSAAAGADISQAVAFGSGPPSGAADEGEIYFDTSGTSYVMYVYHTGAWHSIFGSGVGTGGGGIFSSGSSGHGHWVQDPTGHIHQWGYITTDINGGTVAVTFPTAFSSATDVVVNVTTKSPTDRISFVVDGSVTASGFTVGNNGSSGFIYWEADGPGVASSSSVLVDPTTTEGDMIYRHSGALARLPIGTAGEVLTVVGGEPVWAVPAASPGTHTEPLCFGGEALFLGGDILMIGVDY